MGNQYGNEKWQLIQSSYTKKLKYGLSKPHEMNKVALNPIRVRYYVFLL